MRCWSNAYHSYSRVADAVTLNGGKFLSAVGPVLAVEATPIFGPTQFNRTAGPPNQYVEQFSLAGTISPYTLSIQNGSLSGTNRISTPSVVLNGVEIVTNNDLNENIGSLERTITLSAQNQLTVTLEGDPGSYLIITINGTVPDTTPPLLEITSPANNFTTTQTQITVSGTASDPGQNASGLAHVYVNNVEASYNSSNNTWTLANVSLSLGANQLVVRAVDQSSNETTVTITVTREVPPNQSPTVAAGADQTIALPNTASLNGSATDDGLPAGSTLTTTWSKVSGPGTVTFADQNAVSTTASFSTHGTYILRLTASDGALSATDDVTVTVAPQNQPPTVSAGVDQTIALPATASLSGVVTDDGLPAGSNIASTWSRVSGPGTVSFGNPNLPETAATFSESGTYVLRLTATDGELTTQDEVTIRVHPENQAPTVNAGADQIITLPADAQLNGTVADDGWPFESTLTTNWTVVSGPGTVTFAAPNATVTTASFSVAGTYVLRLTASDSQLTASDDVQVVVSPQNFAPTVNAGPDQTVNLPGTASLDGSVSDDGLPAGSTLTTLWTKVSGPGDVTFASASVTVTTASFSVPGSYVLRLTANDTEFTTSDELSITVIDPRVPPVASFIVPQSTGAVGGFVIASSGAPGSAFAPDLILDSTNMTSWTTNGSTNQFVKIQFYDRLKTETIANDPHGINGLVSYDYDPVGNRLSRTSTVAGVPSQTSTFDANDRLNSDTYDNNGNTTAANSNGYAYDFENRLTSLNNGATTFVYDGDGNRVSKTVAGTTTNYLVDTNNHTGYAQVVEELQGGAVVKQFTFGHDLLSQRIIGGPLSFYSYDGHGSVRQLTDSAAVVTDTYDYDAFGILIHRTGTTPNDYLYSGEQFDANLSFYYLRARYMGPSIGRFGTVDSYAGVNSGPATLHRYSYAHADPINRIDPSGNVATTTVEAAQVNALVSAIVNVCAYIALKEILPRIKQKIDEDSGLFIYRRGNPNSLKTTALHRESDWKSGLSFSIKRPAEKHLKFRVINLLIAGFAVFPDGGREFTNIIEGGPLDGRIAGPDHVSVFLPDRTRWDAWYNSEKDNTTENPFIPDSKETVALYALRELDLPW